MKRLLKTCLQKPDLPSRRSIQQQLNVGSASYEKLQELSQRIMTITNLLDEKELRWLELSEYTES